MTNSLYYSVLRYRPSYLLKEQINVGLLFVFPETAEVIFHFPGKLARVTQFYAEADLSFLKKYLYALKAKAKNTIGELDVFSSFIPKDAGSLYFSEPKLGTYINKEATVDYYKKLYFKPYEDLEVVRKNDAYLKKIFEAKLGAISPYKKQLFQKNVKIKNAFATTTKFEFAWQNGQTNFVKTIGLDLSNIQYIQAKIHRWHSELSALDKTLSNSNIDILVSRPSKKNLFKVYDKALIYLDEIKTPHRIKEEIDIDAYVHYATETVTPLPKLNFIE